MEQNPPNVELNKGIDNKKTRNFKLLVEITGVSAELRCSDVLDIVANIIIQVNVCKSVKVTNIPSYSSVYKRKQ